MDESELKIEDIEEELEKQAEVEKQQPENESETEAGEIIIEDTEVTEADGIY